MARAAKPVVVVGSLGLAAAALYAALLPYVSGDMKGSLLTWFDYILAHGRWAALADIPSNYTPPYLYLMTVASYFANGDNAVILIKIISVVFTVVAAFAVAKIVMTLGHSRYRAWVAAALFLLLPTVVMNAPMWGQADVIFTSFLLLFVYLFLVGQPIAAVIAYGLAISFKLQAIFLAPFIGFLFVSRRLTFGQLCIIPVVYLVTWVPALLEGRPLRHVLKVYYGQTRAFDDFGLSAWAPSLFQIVESLDLLTFNVGLIVGLLLAGLVSLFIVGLGLGGAPRQQRAPLLLALATMTVAVVPFLLPKMHERYFFPADVFTYLLACVDVRFLAVAVGFQIGSSLAYVAAFLRVDYLADIGAMVVGAATVTLGVLLWRMWTAPSPADASVAPAQAQ